MNNDTKVSTQPKETAYTEYIRRAREMRQKLDPISNFPTLQPAERARRMMITGFVLGSIASLVFALVSQYVNALMLPDVRLFTSPFHLLVTLLIVTGIGAVFSLLSVASMKIQTRIIMGGLILVIILIYYFFSRIYGVFGGFMEGLAFLYIYAIPILLVFLAIAPFQMLIAWAAGVQVRYFYRPFYIWKRTLPPLALVLVAGLMGLLFVFSPAERKTIRLMNAMIEQAQAARIDQELPHAIQYMDGAPYLLFAEGNYHLTAQHNIFPTRVYSNGTPYEENIEVGAQFENGYSLMCSFTATGTAIECWSWYIPPAPKDTGKLIQPKFNF